jgi:hypothetical protein
LLFAKSELRVVLPSLKNSRGFFALMKIH